MAGRALICKECKKPARDEGPDCRYCGTPLPRNTDNKCATCAGKVTSLTAPCSHCGAPVAGQRGLSAMLLRCANCSSQISTDAEACPRCKAPLPGRTAVAPQLSAERRAAEQGPSEAVQAALEGRATSQVAVPTPDSAFNRSLNETIAPALGAGKEPPRPTGPAVPCRVCGKPNPPDAYVCPSCGMTLRAQPTDGVAAPANFRAAAWLKTAIGVGFMAAIFISGQVWRVKSEEHDRSARLRSALGPAATDKDVETLMKRAETMGVNPEALLMVNRKCFLTPEKTPTEAEMAEAVAAVKPGEERSKRLVEYSVRRCDH